MIQHWLKVALRGFWRNRVSSCINMAGLTVGLTSCLLIALYVRNELKYDDFQAKGDRISRVIMEYRFDGGAETKSGNFTSTKVAPAFRRNFPEVESAVRMTLSKRVVGYGDKLFTEKRFMYADSSFFDLFSMPLIRGDHRTALSGPGRLVLTASAARRYFGSEDPVGRAMRIGTDSSIYEVTGVMADCPANSQIKFDMLASFSSLRVNQEKTYWEANYTTYVLLKEEKDRAGLEAKLPAFMLKEMKGEGATVNFHLEPFRRIHLYSTYGGFEPNGSIIYVYVLVGVALLILVIVCGTYVNLSTAQSMARAREVGVRKVIGALRRQLFWQFIGESALVCGMAVILSWGIACLLMGPFNHLTDRQLSISDLFSLPFLGMSVGIAGLVSLLAGSYPALVLSGFQPVKVLKGSFSGSRKGQGLRQALIVFQFVISVFLIVSTLVMQRQLHYIQDKKLGYDREHVVALPFPQKMVDRAEMVKSRFRQDPGVLSISRCVNTPVNIGGGYNMRSSAMPAGEQHAVTANPVDEEYVRTAGLQIIAGQDLSMQDVRDVNPEPGSKEETLQPEYRFILNETAARTLGWSPSEAIGKRMFLGDGRPGYVKGVVRDFHFQSLHESIGALVLFPAEWSNTLLIKVSGEHLPQTIASLGATWKELAPYMPFEYRFLDEDYDRMYSAEQRLGKVMNIFSAIAIVLACLGLFGLSAYAVSQRIREIGVRKVLGASIPGLVLLLSQRFVRLSALAILIAFPLAWWVMQAWLRDYSYRVNIGPWVFILSAGMVLLITLATVSIQAIRAALVNPVRSLKSE